MFLKHLIHKPDGSLQMSLPRRRELHGIPICKLTVAKYLQAMEALENLPSLLLKELYPDSGSLRDLVSAVGAFNHDELVRITSRLLVVVPKEACQLISRLLDQPEEKLLSLGLTELAQVIEALWEANDLTDFFATVRRLSAKMGAQKTGSSAGLPSAKASA